MAYEKTVWTDQDVQFPHRYAFINDASSGFTTLRAEFGTIEDEGTKVSAQNMNKIENAIADLDAQRALRTLDNVSSEDVINKVYTTLAANTDFNSVLQAGNYYIPGICPNSPEPTLSKNWILEVSNDSLKLQTVRSSTTGAGANWTAGYTRKLAASRNTSTWTDWVLISDDLTTVARQDRDEIITGSWTFNQTINGTALMSRWGDVAEYYEMDSTYPKGTLVCFGGKKEITIATTECNAVITTDPGIILNGKMAENNQAIALIGRVPVRIIGKVNKFDNIMLSSIPGVGIRTTNQSGIAKALENKVTDEEGIVECVVKLTF